MTTFYSNHYAAMSSATVAPATAVDPYQRNRAWIDGQAETLLCTMDFTSMTDAIAENDVIRLFSIRSNDRLVDIRLMHHGWSGYSLPGFFTSLGLWTLGDSHDGPPLGGACFNTAINLQVDTHMENSSAIDGSGAVQCYDRGMKVWELTNARGLTTYADDPRVSFDIGVFIGLATPATPVHGFLGGRLDIIPGGG